MGSHVHRKLNQKSHKGRQKHSSHGERKYVHLCIQVNLDKPLLAMFALKGKHFKVEYEAPHMLCLNSGKYKHYADGSEK